MHLPFAACKPPPALSTRDEQMKDLTPELSSLERRARIMRMPFIARKPVTIYQRRMSK